MRIKVPFIKRTLVVVLEESMDTQLINILLKRRQALDGDWSTDKIGAIKRYRQLTNSSLVDSKDYVETLMFIRRIPPFLTTREYIGE